MSAPMYRTQAEVVAWRPCCLGLGLSCTLDSLCGTLLVWRNGRPRTPSLLLDRTLPYGARTMPYPQELGLVEKGKVLVKGML